MIQLILPNHANQDETVQIGKTRGNLSLKESIFSNVNVTECKGYLETYLDKKC